MLTARRGTCHDRTVGIFLVPTDLYEPPSRTIRSGGDGLDVSCVRSRSPEPTALCRGSSSAVIAGALKTDSLACVFRRFGRSCRFVILCPEEFRCDS